MLFEIDVMTKMMKIVRTWLEAVIQRFCAKKGNKMSTDSCIQSAIKSLVSSSVDLYYVKCYPLLLFCWLLLFIFGDICGNERFENKEKIIEEGCIKEIIKGFHLN